MCRSCTLSERNECQFCGMRFRVRKRHYKREELARFNIDDYVTAESEYVFVKYQGYACSDCAAEHGHACDHCGKLDFEEPRTKCDNEHAGCNNLFCEDCAYYVPAGWRPDPVCRDCYDNEDMW